MRGSTGQLDKEANSIKNFSKRKPRPQHWYSLAVGNSNYHINLTVNTQTIPTN